MCTTLEDCSSDSQAGTQAILPLSAVFVAQLAHFVVICVFPHERVVFSWHALGTPRHAEQSILEVGTPRTVSTILEVEDSVYYSPLKYRTLCKPSRS